MKKLIIIGLVVIFVAFSFAYIKYPIFINTHSIFIQLVILCTMVVTVFIMINSTKIQINEMRKIEEDKKIVAVEALLYELEQNKNWVEQFIKDSKEGGHLGRGEAYSWHWNPPQLGAYEKYLVLVCKGDQELTRQITYLYSRLESCKIIVYFIHELLVNNDLISYTITNGRDLLKQIVTTYNKRLYKITIEIQKSFEEPIKKLNTIINKAKV